MSYSPANSEEERPGSRISNTERTSLLQHQNEDNNNNNNNEPTPSPEGVQKQNQQQQPQGWNIDPTTKYFSIFMFLVVVVLTTVFSVVAKRDASSNDIPKKTYVYDECHSFRVFTLWKTWTGVTNTSSSAQQQQQAANCMQNLGLVRGKPFPCNSSIDCHVNIPSYCLYGNPKHLVCHHHTGFCSVKTASLPVSLEFPNAGACPLFDNTTDRCGDLLGTASTSSNPAQMDVATKPVVCVTTKVCTSDVNISCHPLYPNKTQ